MRSPTAAPQQASSIKEDLDQLLNGKCPEQHAALPTLDPAFFHRTADRPTDSGNFLDGQPMCSVSLHIGTSNGELAPDLPVYLCIGGAGSNQLALCCDNILEAFTLDNLVFVHLQAPFDKLCRKPADPKITYDTEKQRLRVYACYLFLGAGYIPTFEQYNRFEDHLRLACGSLAGQGEGRGKSASAGQKSAKKNDTAKVTTPIPPHPAESVRASMMLDDGDIINVAMPKDRTTEKTNICVNLAA